MQLRIERISPQYVVDTEAPAGYAYAFSVYDGMKNLYARFENITFQFDDTGINVVDADEVVNAMHGGVINTTLFALPNGLLLSNTPIETLLEDGVHVDIHLNGELISNTFESTDFSVDYAGLVADINTSGGEDEGGTTI